MTIIYHISEDDIKNNKIRLFGYDFVKNNKDNCYIVINGYQRELCEYLILNEIQYKNNNLEIILVEKKIIINMSYMFEFCTSLISLPDISKWDTKNVTNMSDMFVNCTSLKTLPDISKWDLNEKLDKKDMFKDCDKKIIPEKFKESNYLIF